MLSKHTYQDGDQTPQGTEGQSNTGAYLGLATALAPNLIDLFTTNAEEKKLESIGESLKDEAMDLSNTQFEGSNNTLREMSKNLPVWKGVTMDDFGGMTDETGAAISGGLSGLAAGAQTGNPWVAAGATVIGGLLGSWNAQDKNRQKYEQVVKVNQAGAQAENLMKQNFMGAVKRTDAKNDRWRLQNMYNTNYAAFGGLLETNGATWPTGADFIDNGSTHEMNPFGGVQYGIASDGLPNYVEEGEVVIDLQEDENAGHTYAEGGGTKSKYVLSNRVTAGEEELPLLKLLSKKPEQYIGMTYADIYKDIFKKNGIEELTNRQDIKDYVNSLNTRIAKAQEATKLREEQAQLIADLKNATPEEQDMIMQQFGINPQQPMQGEYLAAEGGKIYIKPENRGKFTASAKRAGMGVQEFARHVLANKEDYSSTQVKRANFARNASHWHSDGGFFKTAGTNGLLSNQTLIVPSSSYNNTGAFSNIVDTNGNYLPGYEEWVNNLTQADYDYLSGLEGFDKTLNPDLATFKKRATDKNFQNTHAWINSLYRPEETTTSGSQYSILTDPLINQMILNNQAAPWAYDITTRDFTNVDTDTDTGNNEEEPKDNITKGFNTDWILPAISGATVLGDVLGLTNTPDYSNANRIGRAILPPRMIGYNPNGRYVKPVLVDTRYNAARLANQGLAGINAAKDLSGANRATALANIAAQNYLTQQAMGEALAQGETANNAAIQQAVQLNNAVDRANAEGALQADRANQSILENYAQRYANQKTQEARLRESIDEQVSANKSANWNNFLENLEGYFENQRNRNMANSAYSAYGYSIDGNGNVHYTSDYDKASEKEKKKIEEEAKKKQEQLKKKNNKKSK